MKHPDLIYTVAVGFTTVRPVISDQRTHYVRVMAPDDITARLTATSMLNNHPGVVMVTSATIIDCIA